MTSANGNGPAPEPQGLPQPDVEIGWTNQGHVVTTLVLGTMRIQFVLTPDRGRILAKAYEEASNRAASPIVVPTLQVPPRLA